MLLQLCCIQIVHSSTYHCLWLEVNKPFKPFKLLVLIGVSGSTVASNIVVFLVVSYIKNKMYSDSESDSDIMKRNICWLSMINRPDLIIS